MPYLLSETTRDALEAVRLNIEAIQRFIAGVTVDEFEIDQMRIYPTIRALEIISEATRRLPEDLRGRHPGIDWRSIRDAGNVYRHVYSRVMPARVWDTARYHLDDLRQAVVIELERETPA